MLNRVVFHGYLADEYGREQFFKAATVGEICRAMQANFKTFYQKIRDGKFHIIIGDDIAPGKDIGEKELNLGIGHNTVHVIPAISGSGGNGIFQVILGAVLIVAAVVTYGIAGVADAGIESALALSGAMMLLGGISALLSPTPDQYNSYLFNGAMNTVVQGGPVPIVYGQMMAGSTIISSGISNAQLLQNPASNTSWWSAGSTESMGSNGSQWLDGTWTSTNAMINLYGSSGNTLANYLPPGISVSPAPSGLTSNGNIVYQGGFIIAPFWTAAIGSNLAITFTAATGYSITHVYVDGNDVYDGSSNPFTYTFTDLQGNHHLSVSGT